MVVSSLAVYGERGFGYLWGDVISLDTGYCPLGSEVSLRTSLVMGKLLLSMGSILEV